MKRDIRLLVSDIDNTILRSDGTIAPETTAAFERAARAGMRTVLASSRTVTRPASCWTRWESSRT